MQTVINVIGLRPQQNRHGAYEPRPRESGNPTQRRPRLEAQRDHTRTIQHREADSHHGEDRKKGTKSMTLRINSESIQRNWELGNKADKYSNTRRWNVALPAFRAVGARDGRTQQIANAIQAANNAVNPLRDEQDAPVDTVQRLARAYKYFYKLLEVDGLKARRARRQCFF